jgi:hypothetical protein
MTLLTLMQDAASIVGVPRPTAVVSATDTQTQQLLALANREGVALSKRTDWTDLVTEATHTTLAAELQGVLTTIAPGFRRFVNETQQNRTQQRYIGGPLNPVDWQYLQASTVTGPYQDFRVRLGKLYLFPAPPAGETIAFEYVSNLWCESAAEVGQARWAADDDTSVLPEELMLLGLVWRWKQQKGFDYSEDKYTYELEVIDAVARDGGARTLSMGDGSGAYRPRVGAPDGSWNL